MDDYRDSERIRATLMQSFINNMCFTLFREFLDSKFYLDNDKKEFLEGSIKNWKTGIEKASELGFDDDSNDGKNDALYELLGRSRKEENERMRNMFGSITEECESEIRKMFS